MRPVRGLVACLGAFVLLTFIAALRRSTIQHENPATEGASKSRLKALFSFRTPDSLFPPSAIISLTDDNSTFFLARPAAYGPALPLSGLSGQLWIGSGFGEDSSARSGSVMMAEGELGCSDIPGWPHIGAQEAAQADGDELSRTKNGPSRPGKEQTPRKGTRSPPVRHRGKNDGKGVDAPRSDDGTDDYLHWPLKGTALIKGARLPEKLQDGEKDNQDKEHADIQSLQESAEIAGKVVLLGRGGCGFLEKTKWVQRRGGVALIVGDNIRGAPLVNMYAGGDTSNVTIPSIFTSHTSAHLLSSLIPPGGYLNGLTPIEDANIGRPGFSENKGSGKQPAKSEPKTAHTKTTAKVTGRDRTSGKHISWFGKLAKALGIRSVASVADSSRFPNSGRIDWVQSDNWDEDVQTKKSPETKQTDTKTGSKTNKAVVGAAVPPGFVIGVHDWRDPDLVAPEQEAHQGSTKTAPGKAAVNTKLADAKAQRDAKIKTLAGGNVVPGSGRYVMPGLDSDAAKPVDDPVGSQEVEGNGSWLGRLFGSDVNDIVEDETTEQAQAKVTSTPVVEIPPPLVDTPGPREGLWVTITPTTMSTSPFFDTLLVLVVSPLVTLTVVYALLLLRARIQRRRWRAPKSVVERLPVRVYHTMSSSSTSTSSYSPSADDSSATSPLLQTDNNATLSRTRPRSRTTTAVDEVNESAALTLERQREDLASRYEKKKYRGKQVECVVCLEEYIDGQSQVMSLPCGHEFHAECITPWLTTRRRTCPICKGDVVRSMANGSGSGHATSTSPARAARAALATSSTSRSRSESLGSRTPLLGSDVEDLERGQDLGAASPRTSWRDRLPNPFRRRRSSEGLADRNR